MVLPPNPPPISAGMARMSLCGMPDRYAVIARTMNWPWLELQIVVLLSAGKLHRAGVKAALDDHFGLGKTLRHVALFDLLPAGNVGWLALELHEVVQDRCV